MDPGYPIDTHRCGTNFILLLLLVYQLICILPNLNFKAGRIIKNRLSMNKIQSK